MGAGYRRPPAIAGYHCAFKFFYALNGGWALLPPPLIMNRSKMSFKI